MKILLRFTLLLIALLLVIGWVVATFFPEKLVPMMLNQQLKRQQAIKMMSAYFGLDNDIGILQT